MNLLLRPNGKLTHVMQLIGDKAHRERLQAILGLGTILTAAVLMAIVELQHIQKMSSTLGIATFALLPFVINLGLIGAAIVLWRSQFFGREILRIAAWVLVGMVVIGLLATWTITHQNIRGRPFAHTPFVTVNNLSADGLIGFLMGWYDGHRRHHQHQVETERARLEFLHSSLRHNLLNGLTIIQGNADLLDEKFENDATPRLEQIHARAKELTKFANATDALLSNFRDTTDTSTRPINLTTVLTEELSKIRKQFTEAEFTVDVPNEVFVTGDDFLAELVSNLLRNAVEHNDKSTPVVSISARQSNGSVVLTVADNGPGIADNRKERVLEWNVKGSESGGTGLGLAIANTVVERYDGMLWIEDNQPEGTAVKAELPSATLSETETDA